MTFVRLAGLGLIALAGTITASPTSFEADGASLVPRPGPLASGSDRPVIRWLRADRADGTVGGQVPEGAVLAIMADATDPSGESLTYHWQIGEDVTRSGIGLDSIRYRVVDEGNGTLDIRLTVENAAGETARRATIRLLENVPPTIHEMALESAGGAGATHTFHATVSDPGLSDVLTYHWDFGDGATSSSLVAQHAYAEEGTYLVTLTVEDGDGGVAEETRMVMVGEGGAFRAQGNVNIPLEEMTFLSIAGVGVEDGEVCQLRMELGIEGEGSLGIQAYLPGGLSPGRHRIGRAETDAGIWTQNQSSPGLWTATFGADRKHDPSDRRHFGFWSTEGVLEITEFDGQRIEGRFEISFLERADPSWNPSQATVSGTFGRVLTINPLGPSFYLCDVAEEPLQVVEQTPEPNQYSVDAEEPALRIRFNRSIDPESVTGNVVLDYMVDDGGQAWRAAPGNWSMSDDHTIEFLPDIPLIEGVTYCVRVRSGLNGIRGSEGARLRDESPASDSQIGGACRDPQRWSGQSAWWGFGTLPVIDNVRVEVYQVHRGLPLIPGKSTVTRVFWDWSPPSPDLRIHPAAEINAFLADAWVETGEGGYSRKNSQLVLRSDRLSARDSIDARNSLNFYGWRPRFGGPVTVRATIEPSGQTGEQPRRYAGETAPQERESYAPTLDVDYYFLEVGSWDGGVPDWARSAGHELMQRGADVSTQNLPVVETIPHYRGELDVPDAIFEFEGRRLELSSDLFVASSVPIGWDFLELAGSTDADVIVGLVPQDVLPQGYGVAVHYTEGGTHISGTEWSLGAGARRVILLPISPTGAMTDASTVAHEIGHYYYLCHTDQSIASSNHACVTGTHDHQGFKVLAGGLRGINKDEGNPEAADGRTREPLMRSGGGSPNLRFISRQHYQRLTGTLQVFAEFDQTGWRWPGMDDGVVQVASRAGFAALPAARWDVGLAEPTEAITVSGLVGPDGVVALGSVGAPPGPGGGPPQALAPSETAVTVRILGAGGQELASAPADILVPWTHHSETGIDENEYRYFSTTLPWFEGAEQVQVERAGTMVARSRSDNPPTVVIDEGSAVVDADGLMTLRWTASDPDGDPLTWSMHYTPDGTTWWPLGAGSTERVRRVDTKALDFGPAPAIRVAVSDGFHTTEARVAVALPDQLPVLTTLPRGDSVDPRDLVAITVGGSTPFSAIEDGAITLTDEQGAEVPGVMVVDHGGRRLAYAPLDPLRHETAYVVVVRSGLMDVEGRRLEADLSWSFRTRGPGR